MKFDLDDLAALTTGTLLTVAPDGSLRSDSEIMGERALSFSIDTRSIQPGEVFIALQGAHSDGHDYLVSALQKGASGLIVRDLECLHEPHRLSLDPSRLQYPFVLQVGDTLRAFQSIARQCRRKHPVPLLAVTGSNGKTTVKDMTASILEVSYTVLKSQKSFNNHIGLPLTLVNMREEHEVAVLEMGMNAPGELRHLAGIAKPDIGIITNIAQAHFGFFHSLEAIMHAKLELIQSLPSDGIAVLNADEPLFESMRQHVDCRLVTFGIAESSQKPMISATRIAVSEDATYSFELKTPAGNIDVSLPLPGYHNVMNALAATALIYAASQLDMSASGSLPLSITLEQLKHGLEHFRASPMRMQVNRYQGVSIINDAYNANPASMTAALHTLKMSKCSGRKLAVLGDMFELGDISSSAHYEIGRLAAEVPVARLLLLGSYAEHTAQGAREAGMADQDIIVGESHEALAHELAASVSSGDLALVKASRGMAMEKILDLYRKLLENTKPLDGR